ncbi:F-box domain-containing protein [Cedratvirus Zaza IHUMI]|uniref:F-box domain-containing protein n=1 Tax=Cedratvirus Zaza IHUMI TaxID=2126979 RepID=A0A2R8FE92_9VIRU|nr:F-box domain-containing protein [Cedratvirus Zaza IHUMI]
MQTLPLELQDLPVELQEEILLSLKEPGDLLRACSSSQQNRQICSNDAFWREKFRRENLPLLRQGINAADWVQIYRKSLEVARKVDERFASGKMVRINLASYKNIDFLKPLGHMDLFTRYWKIMRTSNVEKRGNITILHAYNIDLFPGPKTSKFELIDNYSERTGRENFMTRGVRLDYTNPQVIYTGSVPTEDLWFALFQMTYYDY